MIDVNQRQKSILIPKIEQSMGTDLSDRTFAIWGLAFKPETDDIREAPSIDMMNALLDRGAKLQVFDPEAMPNIKRRFGETLTYADSMYEALQNADALVICTEWSIFRSPSFSKVRALLQSPTIFDGRNLYQVEEMAKEGFNYVSIGRKEAKQ